MITIVLSGALKKAFGKEYTLAVSSAKEAINALCLLVPNFREEFLKYDYLIYSKIDNKKVYLETDEIDSSLLVDKLYLVPKIQGAKSNTQKGVGKLIVAAALFFVAGPQATALMTKAGATAKTVASVSSAIQNVSLFLALNGVSALLTPKPPKDQESKESYFIGSDNTVSGVAVPLAYGEGFFDVLPVSVEISSSGMAQSQYGTPTINWSGGGFNWTNPEYENVV